MEIIVPAAGLSTRFPNMRPKYTLTDYSGLKMLEKAITRYVYQDRITVGILKQHHEEYPVDHYIKQKYGDAVQFVYLENVTTGPAETVNEIIKLAQLDPQSEMLVKDCDSFFDHNNNEGSYICVSSIKDHDVLKRLGSKSFVISNNQDIVTDIIEKEIVSDKFCVGGYKFSSIELYQQAYQEIKNQTQEIFVSHVIQKCIDYGEVFTIKTVSNYVDVGTAEDWFEYNDKSTIFCDIDGTIVQAQSNKEYGAPPVVLSGAVDRLLQLEAEDNQIIFTTARPNQYHDQIVEMLQELGFKEFTLLTGLINAKRILINDYNDANPYPRAIAINLRRDQDILTDFL